MPRAPRARQRSASPTGSSAGSRRQYGTSRPPLSAAHCEHAVVRAPVAGVAVGVVQGERARAGVGGDLVERGEQRVERERLAVLVDAEVRVGVEDGGPVGQERAALLAERGEGGLDGGAAERSVAIDQPPPARRAPRRRRPRCCRRATTVRSRPPRSAAMIPARSSRSRPPGTSATTIAESDGSSPSPARKRLARPTSCAWIASTPIATTSSSAGCVPTQQNHAGEASRRRASSRGAAAGRSTRRARSSPAHQPAAAGTIALEALGAARP